MQRFLRVSAVLLAVIGGLAVPLSAATAAAGSEDVHVSRYGGADRYATSLLIGEAVAADAGGSLEWVVLVSGRSWTDAVVAAPLAGLLNAPVLTTPSDELRSDADAFLKRTEVSNALIVGAESDTHGVGPGVVAALEGLDIRVERVSRSDQYATSIAVANRLGTPGDMGALGRTAIVASGTVFADALVAGAFAARGLHPVLLTPPSRLHPGVADYLNRAQIEHVVLMGGGAALHVHVEDAIKSLDIRVTRLSGTTRYDTAIAAAELVVGKYGNSCFTAGRFGVARARVPFDSFSAAPLLGRLCAPLLLADPHAIPRSTAAMLNRARGLPTAATGKSVNLHVFGGSAAVSSFAINNYRADPLGTEGGRRWPQQPCVAELGTEPAPLLENVYSQHTAWSSDCGRIAYVGGTERHVWGFFVAGPNGANPVQLPTRGVASPAWSPDGTRFAFERYAGRLVNGDPVTHIFVVNADGSDEQQLTSGDFSDRTPSWSPDGKRIAFSREHLWNKHRYQNYDDVYIAVMNADGSDVRALTRGAAADHFPAWSPDGKWIAYDNNQSLWVMDIEGRNQREIARDYSPNGHSWSPASDALTYTVGEFVTDETYRAGKRFDRSLRITTLDAAKTVEVVRYISPLESSVTRLRLNIIRRPQWSPDGRSIIYELNNRNGSEARTYVVPTPEF
ncbi:cell wall-binding repeat-containing protein [Candidatus Poriferisodalis sp.]|uniref:cell wall-binding repeat-containing protein n=1 Tax=Candidatus Poriferisodalis sp. TaxID=3101277 RepID=UPI003B0176C2